jgi:hypothetical protein
LAFTKIGVHHDRGGTEALASGRVEPLRYSIGQFTSSSSFSGSKSCSGPAGITVLIACL